MVSINHHPRGYLISSIKAEMFFDHGITCLLSTHTYTVLAFSCFQDHLDTTMKLAIILTLAVVLISMNLEQSEAQLGKVLINIGRKIGGSGKPRQHFPTHPNRKAAEDAARRAGKGNKPVEHAPHKPGQSPHYHPADRHGNIIKDGSHHQYPKRQG